MPHYFICRLKTVEHADFDFEEKMVKPVIFCDSDICSHPSYLQFHNSLTLFSVEHTKQQQDGIMKRFEVAMPSIKNTL